MNTMKITTNVKRPLRSLSGMFFRIQEEATGKWENVCFEDLSEKEQDRILSEGKHKPLYAENVAKILARTLREIGDECELSRE